MTDYRKNLLSEERMVVIANKIGTLTDENLVKAMTINTELNTLGFTMMPEDVIRLAKTDGLDQFMDDFRSLLSDVEAAPMYPNFPTQVMEISEAEFRFHQMLHYFSTYGQELFFGERVSEGWRPHPKDEIKMQPDATLLAAKVLHVITEEEMYEVPLEKVLTKKERMTLPELEIVTFAIKHVSTDFLAGINVPFKENLSDVFCRIADTLPTEQAIPALKSICQHSGDVWRCFSRYLSVNRHSLRTSQKKLIVKLLESFPIEDFEANLCLSLTRSKNIIHKLEFLSYNKFSRSKAHKEAVRKLRNGELKSWNAYAEALILKGDDRALDILAQRPGILVRMIARLLRLGFPADKIADKLIENASALSMQMLIPILNAFAGRRIREERAEAEEVYGIVYRALAEKMKSVPAPFAGKKIFFDEGEYDFAHSSIEMNDKSEEGGYVRSGMAFKLPETFDRVRFFVYWNDENYGVDLDLHGLSTNSDGSTTHVGWDNDFRSNGMIHSGDLTESDSAEYLDIDLSDTNAESVAFVIDSYRNDKFSKIDTCFAGIMAVGSIGEEISLYDPKNCFVSHDLRSDATAIRYGEINVKERFLKVLVTPGMEYELMKKYPQPLDDIFSLREYLEMFADAQGAEIVSCREDADMVLVAGEPADETEISIFGQNFFCD